LLVWEGAPAFSPDGSKIAFSSDRDGDPEIYTMDAANGANPTRLTDSPTINADPDWQPLHDTAPPTISNATPTGTAVKRNASLTATFSEEMNRATITKRTFKLFEVTPARTTTRITNVAVSLSANGLKAKLDPFGTSKTLLPANTKYRAVVTTSTKDLAGNPLAKNYVWTFTTGSR
jgi:dipeptidyl aminopeptidase/acylaminoacyl peptidase